ncbi:hypothetical protein ACFY0A_29805 [Streptomyces sp. NPDC001698]|uniref:hypothetical protein n=1 Tax=unclassified Streptomyces TaxID=2593676 RepID=UPI00369FD21E
MPSAATTTRKTAAARARPSAKSVAQQPATDGKLHIHSLDVHAPVHIPYFTPGDVVANTQAMTSRLPARDLLFYGGLGALAVAGALDWPVALAIGGATAILRGRGRGGEHMSDIEQEPPAPEEAGTAAEEAAQPPAEAAEETPAAEEAGTAAEEAAQPPAEAAEETPAAEEAEAAAGEAEATPAAEEAGTAAEESEEPPAGSS